MRRLIMQVLSAKIPGESQVSAFILGFRVLVAFAMIRTHGWKKLTDFEGTVAHIPDPFGIGGDLSAVVSILANVVFALFVAVGFFTRAAALFILSVTVTGFFVVHWGDPWPVKDVPLMYSVTFLLILLLGPGKYSLDHVLSQKLHLGAEVKDKHRRIVITDS